MIAIAFFILEQDINSKIDKRFYTRTIIVLIITSPFKFFFEFVFPLFFITIVIYLRHQ